MECSNCSVNPADVLVVLWGWAGGFWCDACVLDLHLPIQAVVLVIPMAELGVEG